MIPSRRIFRRISSSTSSGPLQRNSQLITNASVSFIHRVWRATASAAARARRTASRWEVYVFITTRACELGWRPRLPSRLPPPHGGWPSNWHHARRHPHPFRTRSELCSELFSELVPNLCRSCAALLMCRTCAEFKQLRAYVNSSFHSQTRKLR